MSKQKRLFDLLFGTVGLIVCSPLILALVILVRIESRGPGLFVQTRVGFEEKTFKMYKIRTLRMGSQQRPVHEIHQSSFTKLGSFLRKTKLDELPQLWNVVKGEMSLVGPRPSLPSQIDVVEERRKLGVFAMVPGITGLSQIRKIDMSDPVKLSKSDADYISEMSLLKDIQIILRTFFL